MASLSWWTCPPEEFYDKAKEEAERMRVEPLPKAVDRFFKEQEDREERLLLEGYAPTRRTYRAPDVELRPGKDIPSY